VVEMVRRRGRARAAVRSQPLGGRRGGGREQMGVGARRYAAMGWPVCMGACPGLGRACSCDRLGCPAPGAHPASPAWQLQATVDMNVIDGWWETWPEANIMLVTGRVFDVLDVPAAAGADALARMSRAGVTTGPVATIGGDRTLFFVLTRGSPADEDEWWSCGLDSEPESVAAGLRWHCRDSYVVAPPSRLSAGRPGRWTRSPEEYQLPDALRLLEHLVDACEAL
jgi:Bifunctional DNA primase/polymerase, N-terminal